MRSEGGGWGRRRGSRRSRAARLICGVLVAEANPEGRFAVTGFPSAGYHLMKASAKFKVPRPLKVKRTPASAPALRLPPTPKKSATTKLF